MIRKIILFFFLFVLSIHFAQAQYTLTYKVDGDSTQLQKTGFLKQQFPSQNAAQQFISNLPKQLQALGFMGASVDKILYGKDNAEAYIFLGPIYSFNSIFPNTKTQKYFDLAAIYLPQKPTPAQLIAANEKLLNYFENNGHPFAAIVLDSLSWSTNDLHATLKIVEGPVYKIDSILVKGNAKLNANFLQRYLQIPAKSAYNKLALSQISRRLQNLPYITEAQPWRLEMLSTGAVVQLFLEPKRSSQINVLVGLAPNNTLTGQQKLLLTGEANINLKNALGAGETIGINWQQLQTQSPRLNLAFQYPYLFNSPFGLDAGFELYKKDSQWVNINARLGLLYELNAQQSGKILLQSLQTNVGFNDTNSIRISKQLPAILDVSSVNLGVDYQFNNTNYRRSPRRGWEFFTEAMVGTKAIKKSNDILKLKDPQNPNFIFASLYDSLKLSSYQFRLKTTVNKYWPLGKLTIFKAGMQAGWYKSPNIFQNEMFQIGGNKLLRGFDEESIYTDSYAVFTAELRYLIDVNSYFFIFIDDGSAHYQQQATHFAHNYFGTGIGLAFETGTSVFNISLAVGKRDDQSFNLRNSKIHLGFVNYF